MNKIDDILDRLQARQPSISHPDELTERIMDHLPEQKTGDPQRESFLKRTYGRWAVVILMMLGIWTTLSLFQPKSNPQKPMAKKGQKVVVDQPLIPETATDTLQPQTTTDITEKQQAPQKQANRHKQNHAIKTLPPGEISTEDSTIQKKTIPASVSTNEKLHYASQEMQSDSDYVAPSRVDEFIMKFANYFNVVTVILDCDVDTTNAGIENTVHVFPDTKEVDVFGRLLKVAISIDTNAPGYHLNISQQQLYFKLNDERKGLKYLWLAERVNGQILLYSSHSPIGIETSSACYQDFREAFTHTHQTTTM